MFFIRLSLGFLISIIYAIPIESPQNLQQKNNVYM